MRFCSAHLCSKAPVAWVLTQIPWVFSSKLLSFFLSSWVLKKIPWVFLWKVPELWKLSFCAPVVWVLWKKLADKGPVPWVFWGNWLKKLLYLEFSGEISRKSSGTLSFLKELAVKAPVAWVFAPKMPWVFSELEFISPWVLEKRTKKIPGLKRLKPAWYH